MPRNDFLQGCCNVESFGLGGAGVIGFMGFLWNSFCFL